MKKALRIDYNTNLDSILEVLEDMGIGYKDESGIWHPKKDGTIILEFI